MKLIFILFTLIISSNSAWCQPSTNLVVRRVDSVLKLMTLAEKIGQLNQLSSDFAATGPITTDGDKQSQIRSGALGSMLNVVGVERTRQLQQMAMESRLKIPLLFGQDVIHGLRTTFPIPLAEAASWDLEAIEQSARIAATEASAYGIHWTFAPMVDIARDPRWGRVMEGAGEDSYLAARIAAARVKGFQGKGLGNTDAVMACAKHFAAYGAAVGGRDYNSVDMSDRQLFETYLPPFKAAADAGVATFMTSFNDLNGVPATGNRFLQRTILKDGWNYSGFVVSDWGSVGEMINHGYAKDSSQAALQALTAGCDMDMESRSYKNHLLRLVQLGKLPVHLIDDAARRILTKKMEMGLFDNPFKFCDDERQAKQKNNPDHIAFSREIAAKSIVLLKNDTLQKLGLPILPLPPNQKIALIGPLVKSSKDNLGFWSFDWEDDSLRLVSLWQGMQAAYNGTLSYAKGCNLNDDDSSGFAAAVSTAQQADIVVLQLGEARDMSGEAKSRSNIGLPGVQTQLVQAIMRTGKPVVVLLSAGRPLVFNWISEHVPAIVYTWWLGMQAGNAISDVLTGKYNPSGRLPMSFPRTEGQIPIYYNHFITGRPAPTEDARFYVSAYTDINNSPQYCFGYGLGYSPIHYGPLQISSKYPKGNASVLVKTTITNQGSYAATEMVQLYIRDRVASLVRPIKELKQFRKIYLRPGQTAEVSFTITPDDLKFYNSKLQYIWESGEFDIMVGRNSRDVMTQTINWQ